MSGYQAWALARSSQVCQDGQHDNCDGLAYDVDEHRVIRCLCGCHGANDTDVGIPATNPAGVNLASLEGKADAWDEGWDERDNDCSEPYSPHRNNPYRKAKP